MVVGDQVEAAVKCSDMSRDARLIAHSAVSTSLALCSDRALRELVDEAAPIGSGIGGKSALLEVGRNAGLREAGAAHRSGAAAGATSGPRRTCSRCRSSASTASASAPGLRGLAGARRAHHDDELGARGRIRGLPPDVPLAGAAGLGAAARGTGRRGTGRRLLGRRTAGTPPDRGSPAVLGERRAVPGVHPAESARVARPADARRRPRPPTGPAPWWSGTWKPAPRS